MLGSIGFMVAALAFAVYGMSADSFSGAKAAAAKDFRTGYLLLAAACLVWAVSIHLSPNSLQTGVLFGDAVLLLGGVFLALSLFPASKRMVVLVVGSIATLALVWLRSSLSTSDAFVRDGILVFHTPRLFAVILALLLFAVWMRANMQFFATTFDRRLQPIFRPAYFASNLLAFIGVVSFLLSRKNITITISFVMIVAAFVMLVLLHRVAKRSERLLHDAK